MNPTDLLLQPSRWSRFWLASLHLAAILAAFCLPFFWCLSACLAIALHLVWQWRQLAQALSLHALPDGRVELARPDGRRQVLALRESSVVTAWWIVLHLADESGRESSLVLWPDCADREILRQWRVWLRWKLPALLRRQVAADDELE